MKTSPSKLITPPKFSSDNDTNKRTTINQTFFPEIGNKRACHMSTDLVLKREKVDSPFVFREHISSQYKRTSIHNQITFTSESYKSSDSGGFASVISDSAENNNELKKSGSLKLDIDVENLGNEVILKNPKLPVGNKIDTLMNKEYSLFSLPLPEVASKVLPHSLGSPLSPSESHLFEDLEIDKDISNNKTDLSRPCSPCEDIESFHDSGVPSSPPWVWPKSRLPSSVTNTNNNINKTSTFVEKCTHGSYTERMLSDLTQTSDTYFLNSDPFTTEMENSHCKTSNCHFSLNEGKMGLYRVQSCPGILNDALAFSNLHHQNKSLFEAKNPGKSSQEELHFDITLAKAQRRDVISYESCPDVSHVGKIESVLDLMSHRQRDFRRNVRMIQVS